jgi:two-component system, OmpR family, response regulator
MRQPLLEDDVTLGASLSDSLLSDLVVDWYRVISHAAALEQAPGNTPAVALDRVREPASRADDYMATPLEELAARIRAARRGKPGTEGLAADLGEVDLDLNARTASVNGTRVGLTAREWAVLEALAMHAGRPVAKRDLDVLALGIEGDRSSNAIQVYVSRIRNKLGHAVIETVPGVGYRMAA